MVVLILAIDHGVSVLLRDQYDEALTGRAQDFATLLEREPEQYEFEFDAELVPEYGSGGGAYFQVWDARGPEIIRSASLASSELPRLEHGSLQDPRFLDLVLPDGRSGRAVGFTFVPRLDSDITAEQAPAYQDPVVVTGARNGVGLTRTLEAARAMLWIGGGLAIVLAALGAIWAVARGLRPLAAVNSQIDAIDEHRLANRIAIKGLPAELRAPLRRINSLLARLEASFERERRFSANISHELRTPLAALRAGLEVCVGRRRSESEYRRAITEAIQLVQQIQHMGENLLLLTSADSAGLQPEIRPVLLRALAEECWRAVAGAAATRNLDYINEIDVAHIVLGDREILGHVLRNLLSNAVQYTEAGGRVVVRAPDEDTVIEVWDSGPQIPEHQLDLVFERFWRADPARKEAGVHVGLGLPLARDLCAVMGFELRVQNTRDGGIGLQLRRSRVGGRYGETENTSTRPGR
jgi:signal transduction histidine kinase